MSLTHFTKTRLIVALLVVALIWQMNIPNIIGTNNERPPHASNSKVTLQSISSFNEYAKNNQDKINIINDKTEIDKILNKITSDRELKEFISWNKKELFERHTGTYYAGKSSEKYEVYTSTFELRDENDNGKLLIVNYNVDQNILLDAFIYEKINNNLTLTNRNVGILFTGTLDDIMRLNDATEEERKDYIDKHVTPLKENNKNQNKENIVSFLSIPIVNADHDTDPNRNCISDFECTWVSFISCTALGVLVPIWGGVVCGLAWAVSCTWATKCV